MKNLFLTICLTITLTSFSQEKYTFKSGGRIFDSNNQKLTPTELRKKFSDNNNFLKLYNSGRSKKTIGNILLYTGISTVIIKHLTVVNDKPTFNNSNGSVTVKSSNNILYFVGAGLIAASIPVKIGFSKKIKRAVDVLNESGNNKSIGFIESKSIIMNSNGLGLRMTF